MSKPDSSRDHLQVQIRYLTSALSGRSFSTALDGRSFFNVLGRSLFLSKPPRRGSSKLDAFTHLAHLFHLGEYSAVAVTGALEKDRVSLIISITDTLADGLPRVLETVPELEISDPSIFTQTASPPPCTFLEHTQRCLFGLRLLRNCQITGGKLHCWFLANGSKQIRRRLHSIASRWDEDVLEELTRFDASDLVGSLGTVQCDIDSKMRLKIQAAVPQLFPEDGQKLETVVDRSTAAAWTALLVACLRGIRTAMGEARDHVISESAILDIHDWIFILYFVTDSPAIVSLFSVDSLSFRFRQPVPASTDAEDVADDEDIVEILENEEISDGAKFLRHIRTLASWFSAIYNFPQSRSMAGAVSLQVVRATEPTKRDDAFEAVYESVIKRTLDIIRAKAPPDALLPDDRFEDLSAQLRHPSDTATVHCEATLMALVNQHDLGLIAQQTTSRWSIGISRQCCWTCWKLGELLEQDGDTGFVVDGTHRVVFGWVPPAGLPISVLEGLRDALLKVYADVCEEELILLRWIRETASRKPVFFDSASMF